MKDYKNLYPLNTFSGEQKKELETIIDSLLEEKEKEVLEAIEEKEIIDDGEYYSTEYRNGFNDALEQIKSLIIKQ